MNELLWCCTVKGYYSNYKSPSTGVRQCFILLCRSYDFGLLYGVNQNKSFKLSNTGQEKKKENILRVSLVTLNFLFWDFIVTNALKHEDSGDVGTLLHYYFFIS